MMRFPSRRFLAVALFAMCLATTVGAASQATPFAWWKSEEFRLELQLTSAQSAEIDKIFRGTMVELRQEVDELDRLEARLSRLIETNADESVIVRHIDRVETARANLNKTRSLMLVRMRRVLTPDQRARMRELEEAAHRDGPALHRPPPPAEPPARPGS
jgi:Spy/CpxP family protein refolding chaperone